MRGRPFDTVAVPPPPLRLGSRFAGPGADTSPPSPYRRGVPRALRCRAPKPPTGREPRGFARSSPRGDARSRVARVLAACRCRVSMSRCRCSADLAPPGSARGDFGRRGRSSLTKELPTARPPGDAARDGVASRNPPPHPAARRLATAPLVGCSAGSIGMGWRGGDKGLGLSPVSVPGWGANIHSAQSPSIGGRQRFGAFFCGHSNHVKNRSITMTIVTSGQTIGSHQADGG